MDNQKILVVGDAMIDKHTYGSVSRISPEAPVPVIDTEAESKYSLGAGANVAAQTASAGIKTFFAYKSYVHDESHERFERMCNQANISIRPLSYPDIIHPVSTKERIWAGNQQICRIDRENTTIPDPETEKEWIFELKAIIEDRNISCVIFSDYNKGTLTDRLIQSVVDHCKEREIITVLDPKRYSYWGLQNLTLIKPNKKEINITNLSARDVSKELGKTYLLNTLGSEGMRLWQNGIIERTYTTYDIDPIDVCGCGDTVTAFIAIGFLRGYGVTKVVDVARIAASRNMKHRGCYVLPIKEIDEIFRIRTY